MDWHRQREGVWSWNMEFESVKQGVTKRKMHAGTKPENLKLHFIPNILASFFFTSPFSVLCFFPSAEDKQVVRMKEENLFHRRFSLCPGATSPPKINPRTLTRNLSYGGDNDLYNLSPGTGPRGHNWQMTSEHDNKWYFDSSVWKCGALCWNVMSY